MDKTINKFFISLLVVTSSFLCAQTLKSLSHNKKGLLFYKTKDYQKAIRNFKLAIAEDASNYIAHYNLASTYALLTITDSSCNTHYFVKTMNALQECHRLDSLKTKEKTKNDSDFNSIREEYEFNVLLNGLDFHKPEFVRGFITGKTFRTATPGNSYHPIDKLMINNNNTWTFSFHKNKKEIQKYWFGEQKGNPPKVLIGSKKGTWILHGHTLTLLNKDKSLHKKITLLEPGNVDNLYYPDPNDQSGESATRHYWKCGKCGCGSIEGI